MCLCMLPVHLCVSGYMCLCVSVSAGISAHVCMCFVSMHLYVCGVPNIKFVSLACMTQIVQNVKMVSVCVHLPVCICILCKWCAKFKFSLFGMYVS